jgi:tether containing UBX domain for GLUT4
MATTVWIVDSSFKRTQLKVTPGKYLREVLEEACKSRKLNPEEYTLKTQNNKALDLSQPFRLSGLSAGAKLQLTQASKSLGVVSVALQLPESEGGGRQNDKFPSNTSLWLVLRKYEDAVEGSSSTKLNLTQRGVPSGSSGAGRLNYEQPCLHLLGRNLESFSDLQKTFTQLGLNGGSALIRLSYQPTDRPLEEAMQEISEYFNSVNASSAAGASSASQAAAGSHADESMKSVPDASAENAALPEEGAAKQEPNEDATMSEGPTAPIVENDVIASSSETQQQPDPTSPMQVENEPPNSQPPSSPPSNTINGISVYHPPSSSTPAAARQPDDPSVFEPTVDHAKSHQANLQAAGRNKRLPSDRELAEQEEARQAQIASVQSVVVRVRYPDQSQIETTIYASETAADLYGKVMGTLAAAPEPFELKFTGPKGHETIPNSSSKRLVKDLGFKGRVLVTMVWSPHASPAAQRGPSLKEEYRRQATELKVELASQQKEGESAHRTAMAKKDAGGAESGKGKGGDLEAKMKKFLGFGKK